MTKDTTTTPSVSAVLGAFVANHRWEDLDEKVRHEARRSILNFVGGAIGVAHDPAVKTVVSILSAHAGPAIATVIGQSTRLDPMSAAFANAIAANLLDYDDTHLATVIHPSAPVAPVALALAETRGLSGRDVVHAFALGGEVECRLGNSVSPRHYARGWHITTTCGVYGAAAAAARLGGLSAAATATALGIAASQSSGVVANLSNGAKNVAVGNAARNGMLSAAFAAEGFDAALDAIDGPLGWARAAGEDLRRQDITDGLGKTWEIAKNTYKPYPCGIVMHSIVDAALALRTRLGPRVGEIADVVVAGDKLMSERGDRAVHNERDARVSIHHAAAAAFLWGRAGVAEFATEKAMGSEAVAFRARVRAEIDPSMPRGASRITVRLDDGTTSTETVLAARGSLERPLTDAEIEDKVRELVGINGRGLDAGRIIEAAWGLDKAASIAGLLEAVTPK